MGQFIRLIGGVNAKRRRAVVFFEDDDDEEVNAYSTFMGLDFNMKSNLLSRIDMWMDGFQHRDNYFHGWNDEDRKHCFVFKIRRGKTRHRFYGFLWHPLPSRPDLETCVLIYYATKSEKDTDPKIIRDLNKKRAETWVTKQLPKSLPELRLEPKNELTDFPKSRTRKTLDRRK